MYTNQLVGLENTIESLQACNGLREVDLDGNPLSLEPGYRHHVVRWLLGLEKLDGDPILPLDRELSHDYFLQQHVVNGKERHNSSRPATSPACVQRPALGQSCSADRYCGYSELSDATPHFKWNSLPKGRVRLYESDQLNDDPLTLTYLANHILSNECQVHQYLMDGTELHDDDENGNRSFVDRLRCHAHRERTDTNVATEFSKEATSEKPTSASVEVPAERPLSPVTSATDAADPYQTIRRLIQLVEALQVENAQYRSRPNESGAELAQLRIENANMYNVMEENISLRRQVEDLRVALTACQEHAVQTVEDTRGRQLCESIAAHEPRMRDDDLCVVNNVGHLMTQGRVPTEDNLNSKTGMADGGEDEGVEGAIELDKTRGHPPVWALSKKQMRCSKDFGNGMQPAGSFASQRLKSQGTGSDLGSPSLPALSHILSLRKRAIGDDAWESMSAPLCSMRQTPPADKITSTRHAWVLFDRNKFSRDGEGGSNDWDGPEKSFSLVDGPDDCDAIEKSVSLVENAAR